MVGLFLSSSQTPPLSPYHTRKDGVLVSCTRSGVARGHGTLLGCSSRRRPNRPGWSRKWSNAVVETHWSKLPRPRPSRAAAQLVALLVSVVFCCGARATAAAGARAMALGGAVAGARALERSAARAAGFGPLAAPALSQARLCLGLLLLAC